ncbi:hypothetical protein Taro_015366 [Colocasia esculenta]|uniref:Uncharacterized protein n=1 Tax=Colocasia esculenta TaxID=4460 RepID=A0A843UM45_COLES|nr:hypothetical protein [Colocasia esculenta]
MGRAPCCDKASVKKGPWSPEEDAKLKAYMEEHGAGGNWIALPHKIGLKRCGKSCRLRWLNYLRPNLKHGGFSEEEDNLICSLYISIGSRWSIIAAQLPGRTDNDIKNYWNTKLKKKLLGRCKDSHARRTSPPTQEESKEPASGTNTTDRFPDGLSASALERMQLHMQLHGPSCSSLAFFNNPALLPKFHPLADRILHTQHADAINNAAQGVLQHFPETYSTATTVDASQRASFPSNPEPATLADTYPGDVDAATSSLTGFSSPSSSTALNVEQYSDAGFNEAPTLQAELHDLLCGKKGSFGQQLLGDDLDFFSEFGSQREGAAWWGDVDGFEEKSSSSSWGSSAPVIQTQAMFQELMMGFNF